jgi:hypothetical protein
LIVWCSVWDEKIERPWNAAGTAGTGTGTTKTGTGTTKTGTGTEMRIEMGTEAEAETGMELVIIAMIAA